jgi:hypothetical protein
MNDVIKKEKTKMKVHDVLNKIQQELKAPKNQFNSFGKYKYRSCEDILESVKPLLGDCKLVISDEIVQAGDRYYVKAEARLSNGDGGEVWTTAFAREPENKKGMDESQVTGAASSYARKYALNGLFAIDDSKDSDTHAEKNEATLDSVSVKKIQDAENMEHLAVICKEIKAKKGVKYHKSLTEHYLAKKKELTNENN